MCRNCTIRFPNTADFAGSEIRVNNNIGTPNKHFTLFKRRLANSCIFLLGDPGFPFSDKLVKG